MTAITEETLKRALDFAEKKAKTPAAAKPTRDLNNVLAEIERVAFGETAAKSVQLRALIHLAQYLAYIEPTDDGEAGASQFLEMVET